MKAKFIYDYYENEDDNEKNNQKNKNEQQEYTPKNKKEGLLNLYTIEKDKEVIERYGQNFSDFINFGTCKELPVFTSPPEPVGVKRITLDKSIVLDAGKTTYMYIKPFAPINMQLQIGTQMGRFYNDTDLEPFVSFHVVCAKVVIKQVGIMAMNDGYGTAIDAVMCNAGLTFSYLKDTLLSIQTPPGRKVYLADGREGITANFIGSPSYPRLYSTYHIVDPNFVWGSENMQNIYLPSDTSIMPITAMADNQLRLEDGTTIPSQTISINNNSQAITGLSGRFIGSTPVGDALFVRISPPSIQVSLKVYVDFVVQGPLKPAYITNMPQVIPKNIFDFSRLKYALENVFPAVYSNKGTLNVLSASDIPIHLNRNQHELEQEKDPFNISLGIINPLKALNISHDTPNEGLNLKQIKERIGHIDEFDIYDLKHQEKIANPQNLIHENEEPILTKKEKRKFSTVFLKMKKQRIKQIFKKNHRKKIKKELEKDDLLEDEKINPDLVSIQPQVDPDDFAYIEQFNYEIPQTPINPYPQDKIDVDKLIEEQEEQCEEEPDFDKYYYAMNRKFTRKDKKEKINKFSKNPRPPEKDDQKANEIKRKFNYKGTANVKMSADLPEYVKKAIEFSGMDVTALSSTAENSRLFRDGSTPMPFCTYQYFPMVGESNKVIPGIVCVKMEKDAKEYYKIKMEVETSDGPKNKTVKFYYSSADFANAKEFVATLQEVIEFIYGNNSHYISGEDVTIRFFSPKPIANTSYMLALTLAMCGAPSGGYYTGSYGYKDDKYIAGGMEDKVIKTKCESTNPNCPLVVLADKLEDGAFLNIVSGIVPKFHDGKEIPTNSPKIALIYGLLPFSIRMYKETPLKYLQQEVKSMLTSKNADAYRKYIVLQNIRDPEKLKRFISSQEMTYRDFARSSLSRFSGIFKKKKNYITASDFYTDHPTLLEDPDLWSFVWGDDLFVDTSIFAKHIKETNPNFLDQITDDIQQEWKDYLWSVREMSDEDYQEALEKKKKEFNAMDLQFINDIKRVTFKNDDDTSATNTKTWKELKKKAIPFFKLLKKVKQYVIDNCDFNQPKSRIYSNANQAQVLGQLNIGKEANSSVKPMNNPDVEKLMKIIDTLTPQGALILAFASGWKDTKTVPVISNELLLRLIEKYDDLGLEDDENVNLEGRKEPERIRFKGEQKSKEKKKSKNNKEKDKDIKIRKKFTKSKIQEDPKESSQSSSDEESDSIDISDKQKYTDDDE